MQNAALLLLCFISIAVYFASIPECDREMEIDTSKYLPETGITLELCAGIVDKDLPLEDVAKIEVLEECGYDVPVSNLERIISYRYVMLAFCVSSPPPSSSSFEEAWFFETKTCVHILFSILHKLRKTDYLNFSFFKFNSCNILFHAI